MVEFLGDNGILISPECKGITFVFKIVRTWDDQVIFELPELESNDNGRQFWGNVFQKMSNILLDD